MPTKSSSKLFSIKILSKTESPLFCSQRRQRRRQRRHRELIIFDAFTASSEANVEVQWWKCGNILNRCEREREMGVAEWESWRSAVWPNWAIFCTLGNHSKAVATIILPKLPALLALFVKVSKSFLFLVKSFLGNFYRQIFDFYLVTLEKCSDLGTCETNVWASWWLRKRERAGIPNAERIRKSRCMCVCMGQVCE